MVYFRTGKKSTFNWIVSVIILTDFTCIVLSILCFNLFFLNQLLTHIFQHLFRNYFPWGSWPLVSPISELLFLQAAGQHQLPPVERKSASSPLFSWSGSSPCTWVSPAATSCWWWLISLCWPSPGGGGTTDSNEGSKYQLINNLLVHWPSLYPPYGQVHTTQIPALHLFLCLSSVGPANSFLPLTQSPHPVCPS